MKDKKERYYDELIKKRIGEAIREFSEEDEKLDPEIFREWVKEAKRRKIQNRIKQMIKKEKDKFWFRFNLIVHGKCARYIGAKRKNLWRREEGKEPAAGRADRQLPAFACWF